MASLSDAASVLRKLDFPDSTSEAIKRIHSQCLSFAHKQASPKEIDMMLEIIDDYVFCSKSPASSRRNKSSSSESHRLKPLQELQMLQVLIDYFQNERDQQTVSTVFVFLFMKITMSSRSDYVSGIMSKLISMGMGIKSRNILHCAAIWTYQNGPASSGPLDLARSIVTDHILLIPDAAKVLRDLPDLSPLFIANLTTSVAQLYDIDASSRKFPPKVMVETIVSWISTDATLLLTAVKNSTQSSLPPQTTGRNVTSSPETPIVGLAKWCITYPISADQNEENAALYSHLHLELLETLLEAQQQRSSLRKDVVSAKRIAGLVKTVDELVKGTAAPAEMVQLSLDRLGQFLQAVTAANCIVGSLNEAVGYLKKLPRNRLIEMYKNNSRQLQTPQIDEDYYVMISPFQPYYNLPLMYK